MVFTLASPFETYIMVSMGYKRNQLEEAISTVVEPAAKRGTSQSLQVKIKRLLEADRALKRSARATDPARQHYAFFSGEPPGRGVEVQFTEYEVFAVCVALQLLRHGWTPDIAAKVMRGVREDLMTRHARVLRLCAEGKANEFTIKNSPVLVATTRALGDSTEEALECCVRDSHVEAAKWTWAQREGGQGFAMFHFAHIAQQINLALRKTEPRRRGQPG